MNTRVVIVCIAGLLLAGCGGGGQSQSRSGNDPGGLMHRVSSRALVTRPGTRLRFGQSATVPYQAPQAFPGLVPQYMLRVTVLGLSRAPRSIVAGQSVAGFPYYLRFRITNVGRRALPEQQNQADPEVMGAAAFFGSFLGNDSGCRTSSPPVRLRPGQTWTSCDAVIVPGSANRAKYTGQVPAYISSPVVWNAANRQRSLLTGRLLSTPEPSASRHRS